MICNLDDFAVSKFMLKVKSRIFINEVIWNAKKEQI